MPTLSVNLLANLVAFGELTAGKPVTQVYPLRSEPMVSACTTSDASFDTGNEYVVTGANSLCVLLNLWIKRTKASALIWRYWRGQCSWRDGKVKYRDWPKHLMATVVAFPVACSVTGEIEIPYLTRYTPKHGVHVEICDID